MRNCNRALLLLRACEARSPTAELISCTYVVIIFVHCSIVADQKGSGLGSGGGGVDRVDDKPSDRILIIDQSLIDHGVLTSCKDKYLLKIYVHLVLIIKYVLKKKISTRLSTYLKFTYI